MFTCNTCVHASLLQDSLKMMSIYFLDVEDLYEPVSAPFSYPTGLSENASLVEKLKHMEARTVAQALEKRKSFINRLMALGDTAQICLPNSEFGAEI